MLLALLVMAQSVGATVQPPGEVAPGPGRQASCATITVLTPGGAPTRASAFSATRILDLELRADVRPLAAGPHLLELKLYTPHGHLYQVLPVAFEGSGPSRGKLPEPAAWQAAYGNSLPLRPAPLVQADRALRQRVVATLPVAGTSITSASLFGRWRVDAHLDGAAESCSTPAFFRLAP